MLKIAQKALKDDLWDIDLKFYTSIPIKNQSLQAHFNADPQQRIFVVQGEKRYLIDFFCLFEERQKGNLLITNKNEGHIPFDQEEQFFKDRTQQLVSKNTYYTEHEKITMLLKLKDHDFKPFLEKIHTQNQKFNLLLERLHTLFEHYTSE